MIWLEKLKVYKRKIKPFLKKRSLRNFLSITVSSFIVTFYTTLDESDLQIHHFYEKKPFYHIWTNYFTGRAIQHVYTRSFSRKAMRDENKIHSEAPYPYRCIWPDRSVGSILTWYNQMIEGQRRKKSFQFVSLCKSPSNASES